MGKGRFPDGFQNDDGRKGKKQGADLVGGIEPSLRGVELKLRLGLGGIEGKPGEKPALDPLVIHAVSHQGDPQEVRRHDNAGEGQHHYFGGQIEGFILYAVLPDDAQQQQGDDVNPEDIIGFRDKIDGGAGEKALIKLMDIDAVKNEIKADQCKIDDVFDGAPPLFFPRDPQDGRDQKKEHEQEIQQLLHGKRAQLEGIAPKGLINVDKGLQNKKEQKIQIQLVIENFLERGRPHYFVLLRSRLIFCPIRRQPMSLW